MKMKHTHRWAAESGRMCSPQEALQGLQPGLRLTPRWEVRICSRIKMRWKQTLRTDSGSELWRGFLPRLGGSQRPALPSTTGIPSPSKVLSCFELRWRPSRSQRIIKYSPLKLHFVHFFCWFCYQLLNPVQWESQPSDQLTITHLKSAECVLIKQLLCL